MPRYNDPYLREERLNPATQSFISLYDTAQASSDFRPGERWAVFCVVHETTGRYARLADARRVLAHADEFCPDCAALLQAQSEIDDQTAAAWPPDELGRRIIARASDLLGRPLRGR
jgi:hypothetical protein